MEDPVDTLVADEYDVDVMVVCVELETTELVEALEVTLSLEVEVRVVVPV